MAWTLPHLRRRSEFVRASRDGFSGAAPGLVLQMRRRRQDEATRIDADAIRFGVTASRKVGGAVVRNRVRRRLRALAHDVLTTAGSPGCDYVLIGRAATAMRAFPDLRRDLASTLDVAHRRAARAARMSAPDPGTGR